MTSPAYKLAVAVSIDPAQAKLGGKEAVASIAAIKTGAQSAATSLQQLVDKQMLLGSGPANSNIKSRAADIAAYGAQLDALKAKFDPLFAAQQRYRAKLDEINQAERVGAVTASEAIDLRIRETNAINTQINNLTQLSAARKAAAEASVAKVTITPDRAADIAAFGKGLDDLRSKYNPLYAVTTTYLKTQADIREAHKVGAISVDEMTAALSRNRQMTLATIGGIKGRDGLNDNNAGFRRQNLGYQLFDIGQGGASGMPLSMIAAQQLPQIAQLYAGPGGGVKALLKDIGGIASGVVSAFGALPIAIAAAGTAAVLYDRNVASASAKAEAALEKHEKALERIKGLYDQSGSASERYGQRVQSAIGFEGRADRRGLEEALAAQTEAAGTRLLNAAPRASGAALTNLYGPYLDTVQHFINEAREGRGDVAAFNDEVLRIANENPADTKLQKIAERLREATRPATEIKDQIKALNDELARTTLLMSRTDAAAAAARFRIDNADALTAINRSTAAELGSIGARSPEQIAAAARARVRAEPFNPSEDLSVRQARENAAGTLALAQAEQQLRDAQEQRLRSLDNSLTSQQLELSLIGKTVGETERLRMEYQLTTQLKEEAARTGTEVEQAELDIIRQKSAAYGKLAEQIAATTMLRDQARSIETLRAEASLTTASDENRRRSLALLEAEQQLRERGIDSSSSMAEQYRRQALAMSDLNNEIRKQADAWDKVRSTGEDTIDGLLDGLKDGDFGDALKTAADDIEKTLFELAVKNPLKNALLGTDLGTMDDLGGIGGMIGKLLGKDTATAGSAVGAMNVSAGTVIINGGIGAGTGGIANSLLGAANDNSNVVPFSKGAGSALSFIGNYKSGVDPRLTDILNSAAQQFPGFKVDAMSGYRPGDPRFHGKGLATDVQLTDLVSGKLLGNYQDASSFSTYERFAQTARQIQMAKYPELADQFRWGGYFGGGKGKYGALDTMHFDLGGAGMAGGSWQGGLSSAQKSLWPGIESNGSAAAKALQNLAGQGNVAAQGLGTLGTGFDKFGSALSGMGAGGGGGGGGLFGWIGKMLGGISPTSSLWAPNTTLSSFLTTGFDRGGWTGDGGILQPAGVVHKKEIVWSDADIRRAGGKDVVEAMRLGKRGYATGGVVGGSASGGGFAYGNSEPAPLIINNYGSPDNVQHETQTDSQGRRQNVLTIGSEMARSGFAPGSEFKRKNEQIYGLKPVKVAR